MGPHKGKATTLEELQIVADLYREANSKDISTHQYVADEMRVSLSTAAKRIMASRKAGLLPPVDGYIPGLIKPYCVFRLPHEDLEQLNNIAKAKGVTRSFAIREAVRLYAETNKF
jgi:hypothetical protein